MADNTPQTGSDTIRTKDRTTAKTTIVGIDLGIGTGTENLMSGSLPVAVDASRTSLSMYATGSASGTTGTETAQNMALVRGTTATAAAASIALTAGKTTRITGIRFRSIGNATATTQSTIHKLRLNTAGAVGTTTTPILFQCRTTTPATSLASDFFDVPLENGGFDIVVPVGGNYQIGVTAAATFTTNAPTWDVAITGYEF